MLSAGFGQVDITPPPGLDIAGSLSPTPSRGTRDPLFVRAIVLDDGRTRAALVALDLIAIERPEALRARELIAARTGIAHGAIMLASSHTHQGPTTIHYSACAWPTDYMEALPRRIAEAVAVAAVAAEPVEWGHALARDDTVGTYRRVRLADGRTRNTWQLPAEPGRLTPLGEIDPDPPILVLRAGAEVRGVVLNYSCHATCAGDGRWSANYPGYLAADLAERLGLDAGRVLYTAGAAANTNPSEPYRDAAAFDEGGYETIFASQSRLAPEAGELVVEAAISLLNDAAAARG